MIASLVYPSQFLPQAVTGSADSTVRVWRLGDPRVLKVTAIVAITPTVCVRVILFFCRWGKFCTLLPAALALTLTLASTGFTFCLRARTFARTHSRPSTHTQDERWFYTVLPSQ